MRTKKAKAGLGRERTTFEVVILAAAVVAIAAILGGLVIGGLQNPNTAPDLRVEIREGGPASGGRTLLLTVRNHGGITAENVVVEVTVGDVVREITLDAVAKGDEEEAFVVVPADVSGSPHAEVVGYGEP